MTILGKFILWHSILPPALMTLSQIASIPLTLNDILIDLNGLKPNKDAGSDMISQSILKHFLGVHCLLLRKNSSRMNTIHKYGSLLADQLT